MEEDIVRRVIDGLDRVGIAHMIVGSFASNILGKPRSSYDADIVVDIRMTHVDALIREFDADFVVDRDSIRSDVAARQMFNLIPNSGVFKVDLVPLRDAPFYREEFSRRITVTAFGRSVCVASPEDVVLSKLLWHRKGGGVSERQIEDARDVLAAHRDSVDRSYLARWADELGISDLLARILTATERPT